MIIIVDHLSVYANHAACRIVDGGGVVQLPIRAFFWYGTWNTRSWLRGTVQRLPSEDGSKLRWILLTHCSITSNHTMFSFKLQWTRIWRGKPPPPNPPKAHATCSFCIWLIPVTLKQGQGHQPWPESVDSKQGSNRVFQIWKTSLKVKQWPRKIPC